MYMGSRRESRHLTATGESVARAPRICDTLPTTVKVHIFVIQLFRIL